LKRLADYVDKKCKASALVEKEEGGSNSVTQKRGTEQQQIP
jgi:hypothetical protein